MEDQPVQHPAIKISQFIIRMAWRVLRMTVKVSFKCLKVLLVLLFFTSILWKGSE